jgi:hypothetical protein
MTAQTQVTRGPPLSAFLINVNNTAREATRIVLNSGVIWVSLCMSARCPKNDGWTVTQPSTLSRRGWYGHSGLHYQGQFLDTLVAFLDLFRNRNSKYGTVAGFLFRRTTIL